MSVVPCGRARRGEAGPEFPSLRLGTCPLPDANGDRCGREAATWSRTGACESHLLNAYREVRDLIDRQATSTIKESA